MKKVFLLLVIVLFFASCTELVSDADIKQIENTQLSNKKDSTSPNSNGGETHDLDED